MVAQAAAARLSLCLAMLPDGYTPRATTHTVLHQECAHLDYFLAETAAATDGAACLASSSANYAASWAAASSSGLRPGATHACRFERLAPFSCKARAICPSCGA